MTLRALPDTCDISDYQAFYPAGEQHHVLASLYQELGDGRAEFVGPAADGFIADVNATLGQQVSLSRGYRLSSESGAGGRHARSPAGECGVTPGRKERGRVTAGAGDA